MSKLATLLSSAAANLKKNAEIQQGILKHLDKIAAIMTAQRTVLEDICNAFETGPYEDCGMVDTKTINKARKLLGWKMLDEKEKQG